MLKWCWIIAVVTVFSKPEMKIPRANSFFFSYCSFKSAGLAKLAPWGLIPKGGALKLGLSGLMGILIIGGGLARLSMFVL
jgi:hypothetical protein